MRQCMESTQHDAWHIINGESSSLFLLLFKQMVEEQINCSGDTWKLLGKEESLALV